jgi:hypothetical protein
MWSPVGLPLAVSGISPLQALRAIRGAVHPGGTACALATLHAPADFLPRLNLTQLEPHPWMSRPREIRTPHLPPGLVDVNLLDRSELMFENPEIRKRQATSRKCGDTD